MIVYMWYPKTRRWSRVGRQAIDCTVGPRVEISQDGIAASDCATTAWRSAYGVWLDHDLETMALLVRPQSAGHSLADGEERLTREQASKYAEDRLVVRAAAESGWSPLHEAEVEQSRIHLVVECVNHI